MSENVIRDFMVSLGFKVDEASMKKFTLAVENVTKGVVNAGLAVTGAATAVVAGVAIISSQMEKLYYASQRSGESVGNLMALRYAAGQIGLTAEQAQSSLEGFARTLRLNPGADGLLTSLGVTGNGPAEKFQSFVAKMREQQPYVAAAYASLFGIDPDTLLMLENGLATLEQEQQKYRERLGKFGINPEQAASAGRDFNNVLRRARDDFELLWIVIESKLVPVMTPLIERFERWAEAHADQTAKAIADAVEKLANWLASINWDKVGKDIDKVVDALGGAKGVLIAIAAISLSGVIGGVLSLAAGLVRLVAAAAGLGGGAAAGAGTAAGIAGRGLLGTLMRFLGPAMLYFHSGDLNVGEQDELKKRRAGMPGFDAEGNPVGMPQAPSASGSPGSSRAPRGVRNNNPGNIEYGSFAKSQGAVGSDGRFAVFNSMEEGIAATVALLQSYVQRGFNTIRTIIGRWAPNGENNTEAYIASVAKKLGISADQKLNQDQLGGVAQAIFGHENGAAYSATANLVAASSSARLGANGSAARSVTVTQKTDIHVSGTGDPQGTARAVAGEQQRVNSDMVRNFEGAVS
ncbi:hypothetical protein [Herbaspirillum huttiense]|uniref:hypothetical protein n=1 Tax=Herbaspirillum huttiense TaxID=863372 RepID=UPI0031D87EC8